MSSLSGKRVLVTGGSGFIASHLTRRLVNLCAEVSITTKYNSIVDNVRVADLWDGINVIELDLRNLDSLRQVRELKPHVVYHFAAYNHVGDSFLHVNEVMDSNAKGTSNLLESYDAYERFIYISTSEVYGYQEEVPFEESMNPMPISPYSIAKYSGELYARMHMEQINKPIVVLRPFNAFGPYQSPRAVISEIIETCLQGKVLRSTEGKQTRDFNFVGNLVDGFILAAEKDEAIGKVINVGSGREISIRDLILTIHELTGSSSELQFGALPIRPTEIWRMFAANERAANYLGWQPQISFEEGLRQTIDWYREFRGIFLDANSPLASLASYSLDRRS
jgi:UDP-glucose 4-epimerase